MRMIGTDQRSAPRQFLTAADADCRPAATSGHDRIVAVLLSSTALLWFGPYFALELERLIDTWSDVAIADDGFYFLQIARHVAAGDGATFDGVHATSGYQPLWLYLLAAVQWWCAFDARTFVWVAFGLGLALLPATAWVVWRYLRAGGTSPRIAAGVAAAVLFSPVAAQTYSTLCEAALHGFVFLVVLHAAATWYDGRLGRGGQWAFGALLGVFFLARLDGVFLIAGIVLVRAARSSADRWLATARVVLPAAAIAGVYLANNLLTHGHVMPISGALKSLWSGPARPFEWSWWQHGGERLVWYLEPQWAQSALGFARVLVVLPCLWLLGLAGLLSRRWRAPSDDPRLTLLWLAVASFVPKHLYYALLQGSYNDAFWYYTTEYLTIWVMFGVYAGRAANVALPRTRRGVDAAMAALLLSALLWANLPHLPALLSLPWHAPATLLGLAALAVLIAAVQLRRLGTRRPDRAWRWCCAAALPLAMVVAALPARAATVDEPGYRTVKAEFADLGRWMRDVDLQRYGTVGAYSAGVIGYWAGGNVTNLDGLVGDWQWFELSRELGMVPPPRREVFVADYHPPLRDQLLAAGYVLVFDELPRYRDDTVGDEVWVVTADRGAAERVYTDALADASLPRTVRIHALQAAHRHDLAAACASLLPVDPSAGDVLLFDLRSATSSETVNVVVDGRVRHTWRDGVHAIDLLPLRGHDVEIATQRAGVVRAVYRLP
jgi:hypothetical protein